MSLHKQTLVVRKDLSMGKGKIAAQCAHASLKVLLDLGGVTHIEGGDGIKHNIFGARIPQSMVEWLANSFTKVVVSVNSEEELLDILKAAKTAGLLCSLITDNGKTEFHGVLTNTVVAVGPGLVEDVDKITGHLPLL